MVFEGSIFSYSEDSFAWDATRGAKTDRWPKHRFFSSDYPKIWVKRSEG
jgi:hypothetical protein